MSALTAVSSNISGYNGDFSVINLESISSYVNQSMEAVTSAMNAFSSLAMFLQTIMVRTNVDLCITSTTYKYVRMYVQYVHCCALMHVGAWCKHALSHTTNTHAYAHVAHANHRRSQPPLTVSICMQFAN